MTNWGGKVLQGTASVLEVSSTVNGLRNDGRFKLNIEDGVIFAPDGVIYDNDGEEVIFELDDCVCVDVAKEVKEFNLDCSSLTILEVLSKPRLKLSGWTGVKYCERLLGEDTLLTLGFWEEESTVKLSIIL